MTPAPHRLTLSEARRIMVRAQLLDAERPDDLLDVVRHLTLLQLDPATAIAPSADVVAWSRLGASYRPEQLRTALDEQRLVELHQLARPCEDLALHRAEMAAWPGDGLGGDLRPWQEEVGAWVEANDSCRREMLEVLRQDGPLPASALPDTCEVPWRSTGWTNNKNRRRLLDFLVAKGEVAAAGWSGRDKLWDLAGRVYPDDPVVPAAEAVRRRDERRLACLGVARGTGPVVPGEPMTVGEAGEPAVVDGVPGEWRVDPAQLDRLGTRFAGRVALLSPLDLLVRDRSRLATLFDYEYKLEMYQPATARRWGYWAMPILDGDRLVGKLDAKADRAEGALVVNAVHEDTPFSASTRSAVEQEIADLAAWLGLDVVSAP